MPRRCERALSGRSSLASSGIGAAAGALISKGGGEARRRRWQQQAVAPLLLSAATAPFGATILVTDYVIK